MVWVVFVESGTFEEGRLGKVLLLPRNAVVQAACPLLVQQWWMQRALMLSKRFPGAKAQRVHLGRQDCGLGGKNVLTEAVVLLVTGMSCCKLAQLKRQH